MQYFIFSFEGSSLLLHRLPGGAYAIPSEPLLLPHLIPRVAERRVLSPLNSEEVTAMRVADNYLPPEGYQFVPLRQTFSYLSHRDYSLAGKCSELLYWDTHTCFCSRCGAALHPLTSISKGCAACGKEYFPALSLAVIVLIHRGDDLLLVRAHDFQGRYFGLVAGFVETGESLEEAVLREIREEVGIDIRRLRYMMSQAWPFPCGVMVGYEAEYDGGEIILQKDELAEGGWYNIHSLPPLPSPAGIAYQMIQAFIHRKHIGQ